MDGKKKPYMIVILIQSIYTLMFLLSKAAFNGGINTFIFTFYRQAAATLLLLPLALCAEWKTAPPLSFKIFCKIFLLSLFGITSSLELYGVALVYTSSTLASATTNSLPVITFFLAVLFRMEVLKIRSGAGIAKLVGVVVCMGGVITLALYKGPHVYLKLPLCHHSTQNIEHHVSSGKSWVKGCFIMLTSNTLWGLWIVLQGQVLKSYPSKLLMTALQCFLSSVQSFIIAIAVERDPTEWKLGWNIRLLAILYCGFVVTGVAFYLQAWVIEKKGPVFLAMSTPLSFIITLFAAAILFCESITLGSLLGGILLIGGLYSVLWGKSRELKMVDDDKSGLPVDTNTTCLPRISSAKIECV